MPKLKALTLEQYLEDNYGEDAESLKEQAQRLGASKENMVGFVYAHSALNSNRFYETFKNEVGFAHDSMYATLFARCRAWVIARLS